MKEKLESALQQVSTILEEVLPAIPSKDPKQFLEVHHKDIQNLLTDLKNTKSSYIIESVRETVALHSQHIAAELQSVEGSALSFLQKKTLRAVLKDIYTLYLPLLAQKTVPQVQRKERDMKEDARYYEQALLETSPLAKDFSNVLSAIKQEATQRYACPRCFISYAWASEERPYEEWVQPFLEILYKHLKHAGMDVKIDIKDSRYGNNTIQFMNLIKNMDYVLLIGTESLLDKHESGVSMVCHELVLSNDRRKQEALKEKLITEKGKNPVIPLLLSGTFETALPAGYRTYTAIEEFKDKSYVQNIKELVAHLYGFSLDDTFYKGVWEPFEKEHIALTRGLSETEITKLKTEEQTRQILDTQQREKEFMHYMGKEDTRRVMSAATTFVPSEDHPDKAVAHANTHVHALEKEGIGPFTTHAYKSKNSNNSIGRGGV